MTNIIYPILLLSTCLGLIYSTSIPLNYSAINKESEELFLDADPSYLSMEDLASKEKVIIPTRQYHPPGIILRPPPPPPNIESGEEEISQEVEVQDSEEEEEEEEEDEESEEGEEVPSTQSTPPTTPETLTESVSENPIISVGEELEPEEPYTQPLPVKAKFDEELDEKLFLILQNAVRETYFSFRDILGTRHRTQMKTLEDDLTHSLHKLDVDLNVKVVALDTTTHSRIQTLTDQIIDQRKEDIQTFSDNLHQLQKTHQMHIDSQKVEIQQLQVTMDLLNKGQSTISTKTTQLQKLVNNLDSKVNEIVVKTSEDLNSIKERQGILTSIVDEIQLDIKTNDAEFKQMQEIVKELQKSSNEDHGKLRRTLIRDQKLEPMQIAIRHLKNKNVGAAIKQWRTIESIADDLKETLPGDISKIIDDSYGKNAANLPTIADFVHRAVGHGDKRLKESAYGSLVQDMDPNKQLTDPKKTIEIFNLAQTMKADLGNYYNSSMITAEIVSRLPQIIKLITFDKVKLLLPTRGFLRVAADRKVTLVPTDGRFYEREEILWNFEYDKDKSDGIFYIKSDKLQKYLVTLQEGFNSYGFSKQGLFVTGNKKENGTRFQITIVNQGEYVLLKSVYYNGYLTWKSNTQTIYGDDDSYFLLLVDRKNGPSPYLRIVSSEDDEF